MEIVLRLFREVILHVASEVFSTRLSFEMVMFMAVGKMADIYVLG